MDSTLSISKGVFVIKNGKTISQKRRKSRKNTFEVKSNPFSNQLWYQTYNTLWNTVEKKLKYLNDEMFSLILSNLISFAKNSYHNSVSEIPAAALLTGINMPDHAAQFETLAREIKEKVSPHVTCLYSEDCQNLKQLIENMIDAFVNATDDSSDDEDSDEDERKKSKIKKSSCNFGLLQAWYEDLYFTNNVSNSPKKQKTRNERKVLVVIIPDFESFSEKVLQDFILIASSYINVLPFVLVFGIATSLTALHRALPYHVSSKVNIQVFSSQPSTTYLNSVVEHVFFAEDFPFRLGRKVFNLFTDVFLFYDLSVTGFIKNCKYATLEHFSQGNAMALCTKVKDTSKIFDQFSHEDLEDVRHLLSFRKLVENSSPMERIALLTDDAVFKKKLHVELMKFHEYLYTFHFFLKCLQILVTDLPKYPLGKQLREIYALAVSKNISQTQAYKESFQLLSFQSKDELCRKISAIEELLLTEVRKKNNEHKKLLEQFHSELAVYVNNLRAVGNDSDAEDMEVDEKNGEDIFAGCKDRTKLKSKLLELSKKSRPMNKYEKLRQHLLQFLSKSFEQYLLVPTSLYFHEIFFFDDISIQNHIIGTHRAAIHTALNDPYCYLQCACCEISDDAKILRSMPDICVAYKLHLEGGKMINLYDWLQAFLSIVDPTEVDDEEKRIVNPELQARFTQAIAELEFLGFIKSSKRKTDHVSRLTWGG